MKELSNKDRFYIIRKQLALLESQHTIHTPSSQKCFEEIDTTLKELEAVLK